MEFRSIPAISCVAREWRTSKHSLILPGYILWHFHKLALTWLRCFYAATCLILVYHRSHWLAKIAKNSIKLNDQSQKATKGQVVEIEPRTHHEKSQSQATRRNDRKYPSQKPPCSKQMPPEEGAAYNISWDPIQGTIWQEESQTDTWNCQIAQLWVEVLGLKDEILRHSECRPVRLFLGKTGNVIYTRGQEV